MRISQRLLLIGLAIAAVFTVTPLALDYGLALPWIAGPLLVGWVAFAWFRGWRWIADDDPNANESLGYRLACAAGVLFWSFVGLALAIFLAMLAIRYWVDVVAALLVLGVFIAVALVWDWLDSRAKRRTLAAPPVPPKTDDIVS